MVDRAARDWLADLAQRVLVGEFDPFAQRPFPKNPHADSRDPIVEFAMDALNDYCGGKHQLNGTGTVGVIVNAENEARALRNLITFLRSDLEYQEPPWPRSMIVGLIVFLLVALGIAFLLGSRSPESLPQISSPR